MSLLRSLTLPTPTLDSEGVTLDCFLVWGPLEEAPFGFGEALVLLAAILTDFNLADDEETPASVDWSWPWEAEAWGAV